MITVYVWPPALSNIPSQDKIADLLEDVGEYERSVGHSSLLLERKGMKPEYLSFWPKPEKKEIALLLQASFFVGAKFSNSYAEDQRKMRPGKNSGMSARSVQIAGLNEGKVSDCIKKMKGKKVRYNLYVQNCSTLVAHALETGADKGFFNNIQRKFSQIGTALDAAAGLRMADSQRIQKYFSNSQTLFATPSAIGVQTPVAIWEYASRLAQ